MLSIRNLSRATVGLFAALTLAPAAGALNITGLSITAVGANTADSIVNTGNPRTQVDSNTAIVTAPSGPVADTIGSNLSFQTQYSWLVAADRDGPGGGTSLTQNATAEYQITFTVDNPTGATYQVDIDTLRIGALTVFDDDAAGGATGSATLGAVTGSVDSIVNGTLALAAFGPFSSGATGTSAFSQSSSTLSITDNALSRTFTLNFTWTGGATSAKDEAAIRMGISGGLTGPTTADDYPGVGSRTIGGDGHFVTVNTQILSIPEPESGALVAFGLLGLGVRRRAKASSRAKRAS
jgi:hypothetical protein